VRRAAGGAGARDLAVAFGDHEHAFGDLLALVRRAEALGYRAAYVDGDATLRPSRPAVLDGWTATVAILACSERIEVGSIRLVHHWNAARLAQAVATAESIAPGRLRFLVSIGGQAADRRFGLPVPSAGQRIEWLREMLGALRRLWRGETVTAAGRWVRLEAARVGPAPRGGLLPIEVAGRGPRLLGVVAEHADRWDVNLPPVRRLVAAAIAHLEKACAARGRDPAAIGRSLWAFTRLGSSANDDAVRAQFRRLCPWFASVPDEDLTEAIIAGSPRECRERIAAVRSELGVDLPVIDLSGLERSACEHALEALAGS
jgi:alkanesulfonate monooxygenase SsuD/methylene tetrahydromethanopterin reductase-like flavin-dependent oxidoreductase (luciferase family)